MVQIFNVKTNAWDNFYDEQQLYCYTNYIFRMHDMNIGQISNWIKNLDKICQGWDDSDYYAFVNFDYEDEELLEELKNGALFSYKDNTLNLISYIIAHLEGEIDYFTTMQKGLSI